MLTIWGRASSINVQKVLWLAGELDLTYRHIEVGGKFGGLDAPEFLAMNPHGRVPVLADGDTVVWESHTILRYLAASHGEGSFWAADAAARAGVEQWMDWTQTRLQPHFIDGVFWGYYRTPSAQRDWPAIKRSLARCAEYFHLLDGILQSRPFLAGNALSLADIAAGTLLYRYFSLDLDRPPLPNVEAWYGRLQKRPAYRKHVMVAFDEFFGRLAY